MRLARERLGTFIDTGEPQPKEKDPIRREFNLIRQDELARILTYDVSPVRPWESEMIELFPWNEAIAYQRAYRDGQEQAEDEYNAGKR